MCAQAGPEIYIAVPPPLASAFYYGMNETVINSVLPHLMPLINAANQMPHPVIDVFGALGGTKHWNTSFPPKGELGSHLRQLRTISAAGPSVHTRTCVG